jgi:hypothetical protein
MAVTLEREIKLRFDSAAVAQALGRGPADYLLDSYRGLFVRHCEQLGTPPTDMLFDDV